MLHSYCYLCFYCVCFYCLDIIHFHKLCHFFHGLCIGRTSCIGNKYHAYNSWCLLINDYEYELFVSDFKIELLLNRLYLSFIWSNLLAILRSELRALCCFVGQSSLLLRYFFRCNTCRNSFYGLFCQICLFAYIFHMAIHSQTIVFKFL